MHTHRDAGACRLPFQIRIQPLFIERMARLVDRRVETVERVRPVDPCGQPRVAPGAGHEGVRRQVQPAGVPIVSHATGKRPGQRHLGGLVEVTGNARRRGLFQNSSAQIGQAGAQAVEGLRNLGLGRAGLVALQQRVIEAASVLKASCFLPGQINHLLQQRQKRLRVVLFPRLPPDCLRTGAQARRLGGQAFRDAPRTVKATADLPDIGLTHRVQCPRIHAVQPVTDPWIGPARVQHPAERCRLLGPLADALGRHHHFLVPGQQPRNLPQRLRLFHMGQKFGVCRV